MSEIHTLSSSYSYFDPLFSGSALNASPPFSGSALNASPLSTDANASARHETKITFEFYGADALPKPANRPEGWSSGGTARTRRRGVGAGGFTWAIPYAPMFYFSLPCQWVVYWSANRAAIRKNRCSILG
ncbi:hypothetical protein OUZ56_026379 [Daphnia magna]|uniref:Uncharacterized protein n=1 Tax=Daphnia magna TaxID=35525 RepID=A0ABQ9ZMB6_9CRUS|nr:hypothetical protein OUZ56_026379 [Daphnia magna]